MRVELHRFAYNAGHFVVAAVFHAFHDMEYASLYGFQPVFDMRNGALQDNVRGIVEKPVLIHTRELEFEIGFVAFG